MFPASRRRTLVSESKREGDRLKGGRCVLCSRPGLLYFATCILLDNIGRSLDFTGDLDYYYIVVVVVFSSEQLIIRTRYHKDWILLLCSPPDTTTLLCSKHHVVPARYHTASRSKSPISTEGCEWVSCVVGTILCKKRTLFLENHKGFSVAPASEWAHFPTSNIVNSDGGNKLLLLPTFLSMHARRQQQQHNDVLRTTQFDEQKETQEV